MELKDKVIIVTGASRGIGKAIALKLGQHKATVVLAARNKQELDRVATMINQANGKAISIKTDVTNIRDVEGLVNKTINLFGKLDILINNAGVYIVKPLTEVTEQEWDNLIDTNLKGAFLTTKFVAREMIKQKQGYIINIASVGAKIGSANRSVYCASKFGLMGLSKSLQKELKKYNIQLTVVCPSATDTDLVANNPQKPSKGIMLTPEKVANTIYKLILKKRKPKNVYIINPKRFFVYIKHILKTIILKNKQGGLN